MAAVPTLEQEAAAFEYPAGEILLELSDDESGQAPLLLHALSKARPVLGNGLVENGFFRAAAGVALGAGVEKLERVCVGRVAHQRRATREACQRSGSEFPRLSRCRQVAKWRDLAAVAILAPGQVRRVTSVALWRSRGAGGEDSGSPCQNDFNCCSDSCSSGACDGEGDSCRGAGSQCDTDSECCSSRCGQDAGTCDRLPHCRSAGEACSGNGQCCSLGCAEGYCAAMGWCRPAFEPCTGDDMECCSGRCADDEFGFLRCLPIGGCRPSGPVLTFQGASNTFGEICQSGCDCCSNVCGPDERGVNRCQNLGDTACGAAGQVQLENGEICETQCQCLSGICDEPPPPDSGGQLPKRCLEAPITAGSCRGPGEACVDPSECCDGLCLPDTDACGFTCGGGEAGGSGG